MQSKLFLFLWLAVCVLTQELGLYADNGLLSEADLRKAVADATDQVNAFYQAENFTKLAPSPAFCNFLMTTSLAYKEPMGSFVQTEKAHMEAGILARSGRIITYYNWNAFNAAYSNGAPVFDKPPPATWTEAHAIEVASQFADIFVKPWGVRLGEPRAHFNWTYQSRWGEWTVKWRRETSSGIPFANDVVSVGLSEQFGPDGIGIGFASQYDDENITPIAQDKALIEARKGLDKIVGSTAASDWLSGGQALGKPEIELMVVQPNGFGTSQSLIEAAASNQLKARLAWVVQYKVQNPSIPNTQGTVLVYIDAKDGSFLGGMF